VKYFLLGQAWTYKGGKKGMTSEAVSARKSELAVWLREGLVKLGVSQRLGGSHTSKSHGIILPRGQRGAPCLEHAQPTLLQLATAELLLAAGAPY
jgi:hypothetical protein